MKLSEKISDYSFVRKKTHPLVSWYPICPKCDSTGVRGIVGVEDSKGVRWYLGTCPDCKFMFRYVM